MGYFKHSVTCVMIHGWDKELIAKVDAWLAELSPKTSDLIVRKQSVVNDYVSFTIVPDGSKEGWAESETVDLARRSLVGFAPRQAVDVYFGGDEPETRGFNNDVPESTEE